MASRSPWPTALEMSSGFCAEFAHLRAAVAAELPDWNEIRLVFRVLEPYATTPEIHEALEDLITASDRVSLFRPAAASRRRSAMPAARSRRR
jgi:hypothetical protein